MRFMRVFLLLALLAALLLLAAAALAVPLAYDDEPPNVPHSIVGRVDCLSCHGSGGAELPDDHEGRPNPSCPTCHTVDTSGIPTIPHATAGRENCGARPGTSGRRGPGP